MMELGRPDEPDMQRISSIELKDISEIGVGGWADHAVPVGTEVALFFSPHSSTPTYDVYGTVVRTEAETDASEYALGIELKHSSAA